MLRIICSDSSLLLLSGSVSSILSKNLPFLFFAKSQLKMAVRAPPT